MEITKQSSFSPITIKLETEEEVNMFLDMLYDLIHLYPPEGPKQTKEMAAKIMNLFSILDPRNEYQ